MNFNYIKKGEAQWKNNYDFFPQTRYISILDFQHRILDMAESELKGAIELTTRGDVDNAIYFCIIVKSNLIEFIQTRLINVRYYTEYKELKTEISNIFQRISDILDMSKRIESKKEIKSDFEFLSEKIQVSHWSYVNTGEDSDIIMEEMECLLKLKHDNDQYILLCNAFEEDIEKYVDINELSHHIQDIITVPDNIFKLDDLSRNRVFMFRPAYKVNVNIQPLLDGQLEKEVLIRTPYASYVDTFLEFHSYICTNDDVSTIFMTLYRTAKDSVIVKNLIEAASIYHKDVYVYVELTARGDEEHNLEVVKKLIAGGVHVKVGYLGYKVHAKMTIAVRNDLTLMAHVGTGNYNEKTAECYTDFHVFTSDQNLCSNLTIIMMAIFKDNLPILSERNVMSTRLCYAPVNLRDKFIQLIRFMCKDKNKIHQRKAFILIKCNHLYDKSIIQELYHAADMGVNIKIICRTCCGIIPRENLEVRSKLGYFLEHDRFYIFGDDHCYISSSDLMTRNLSKRVELLVQMTNEENKIYLKSTFYKIWDSERIHQLQEDNEWKLINSNN